MAAFFDTNILIYTLVDDPKGRIARLLLSEPFVISVQTLNEFASVARRKLKLDVPTISEQLNVFRSQAQSTVPLTTETHDLGLVIVERFKLSVYDAMIVSAALLAGCETLYSEDMQDGMIIEDRMIIRNPFG